MKMLSDPRNVSTSASELFQSAATVTTDLNDHVNFLDIADHETVLCAADRLAVLRQRIHSLTLSFQDIHRQIQDQLQRAESIRERVRWITAGIRNARLLDCSNSLEHHDGPEAALSALEPFDSQFEITPAQQVEIDLVNAAPPLCYDDPYVKLVRDPTNYLIPGRVPAPGSRCSYFTLGNKALVQSRQARKLAFLDTTTMDEELVYRILQHPEQWGAIGCAMENNWGEMMDWHSFVEMEQRDDQRDMVSIWPDSCADRRLFGYASVETEMYREGEDAIETGSCS